jgi:hypothetical protein
MLHEVSTFDQKKVITIRPRKAGKLLLSFVKVSRQSVEKSLSSQNGVFCVTKWR